MIHTPDIWRDCWNEGKISVSLCIPAAKLESQLNRSQAVAAGTPKGHRVDSWSKGLMRINRTTHVCFSDESNWNRGRYRSLGMVSLRADDLAFLEAELASLLRDADISEFKWKKLQGFRYKSAAEKMCDFAIKYGSSSRLRVDVLIWDTEDSRHKVKGRDDIQNINIMYYHLFRNVFRMRWPDDSVWKLYPDEHTALDWKTLQECLDNVRSQMDVTAPTLFNRDRSIRLWQEFGPAAIHPAISEERPLLQLADLFAGMSIFSYQEYSGYKAWQQCNSSPNLFSFMDESLGDTNSSKIAKVRFALLHQFYTECKKRRLGVGLNESQGLLTRDPRNPLNFWMYMPQHAEDKAPLRNGPRDGKIV